MIGPSFCLVRVITENDYSSQYLQKSVVALTSCSSIKALHLNVAKRTGMVQNCEGSSGDFWQCVLHSFLMVFRKVLNITSCTGLIFSIAAAVEEACPSTKQRATVPSTPL